MAKLKMKRMRLILLQKDSRELFEDLQRLGITELTEVTDERLDKLKTDLMVSVIERNLKAAEDSLRAINTYSPQGGGITKMFSGRDEITPTEYSEKIKQTDSTLRIADSICDCVRRIDVRTNDIRKCESEIEQLTAWESLDIPMQIKKTSRTVLFIGTFPGEYSAETLTERIAERSPDSAFDLTVLRSAPAMTATCIIVFHDEAESIYRAIRELGFTAPADPTEQPPAVRKQRILEDVRRYSAEIKESKDAITAAAIHRDDIKFLCDYLTVKRDQYAELSKIGVGDTVMVCEGYIPEKYIPDAEEICRLHTVAAEFGEPDMSEDIPVMLENGPFTEPMESVVEMYSMPGKGDIDPSAVMAFFYYFLFGMMLSDAGYGIMMTLFSVGILTRTSVEGSMAKMLKMFFWCGISTTIWGVLFGSFFGDIIQIICTEFLGLPAPDIALWFTPIENAMTLLAFSLGVGIAHLLLGLITAIVLKARDGDLIGGLLDNVPVILLLLGIAPFGGSIFVEVDSAIVHVGLAIAVVGIIGIVLFSSRNSKSIIGRIGGGLYALYNNVSGYLSDILSYSRLLALGLATGSIAEVINMMGTLPEGKVSKAVLLTVVFIFGHALNFAINLFGAYVHTVRLQFVELFPKFYEGGGRAMKPFTMYTKYFKIRKDKSVGKTPADR